MMNSYPDSLCLAPGDSLQCYAIWLSLPGTQIFHYWKRLHGPRLFAYKCLCRPAAKLFIAWHWRSIFIYLITLYLPYFFHCGTQGSVQWIPGNHTIGTYRVVTARIVLLLASKTWVERTTPISYIPAVIFNVISFLSHHCSVYHGTLNCVDWVSRGFS